MLDGCAALEIMVTVMFRRNNFHHNVTSVVIFFFQRAENNPLHNGKINAQAVVYNFACWYI